MSIPATGLGGIQPITAPIPGWYGKLPCLGDFASRRLPREFIENWDAWLQRSIAASRRELGERWLDLFLTSPMWRFALAPGACGRDAWAGLLVPSVDKVGRYFPLTIAVPLERCDADLTEVFAAHSWYAEIEKVALAALNVDYAPSELEAALAHRNPILLDEDDLAADPRPEHALRQRGQDRGAPRHELGVELLHQVVGPHHQHGEPLGASGDLLGVARARLDALVQLEVQPALAEALPHMPHPFAVLRAAVLDQQVGHREPLAAGKKLHEVALDANRVVVAGQVAVGNEQQRMRAGGLTQHCIAPASRTPQRRDDDIGVEDDTLHIL